MSKITIDRDLLEQALEALEHHVEQTRPIYKTTMAIEALIAALEQPQDHSEQRLDMVPADWKLVPVEPTSEMIAAGKESMQYSIAELPAFTCYNAMLRAAPQPPVVEQPQVEQEPAIYPEEAFDMGLEAIPYYTHPQPKREPLTDEQITELADAHMEAFAQFVGAGEVWFEGEKEFARAIERAHGIGGEK